MTNIATLCNDWVSTPGDTIQEVLLDHNISISKFASSMGLSISEANDLLEGHTSITIALARKLTTVLGASIEFWMARDGQFREDLMRLSNLNKEWLQGFPLNDMARFEWIKPAHDAPQKYLECLRFFNVSSVAAWHHNYAKLSMQYAFRKSPTIASHPQSVVAWLRKGEIEANSVQTRPFDRDKLRSNIPKLRALTRIKEPGEFLPRLQKICAECGVAVVAARAPKGCTASGATRFITEDKALLLMSFRFLTDDHFWFSFFHELGHILLHGVDKIFIEDGGFTEVSQEEHEANNYSVSVLIPATFKDELSRLPPTTAEVLRFSVHIGIAPGIVVGQLQHLGRIGHNKLNSLKRHYHWQE